MIVCEAVAIGLVPSVNSIQTTSICVGTILYLIYIYVYMYHDSLDEMRASATHGSYHLYSDVYILPIYEWTQTA